MVHGRSDVDKQTLFLLLALASYYEDDNSDCIIFPQAKTSICVSPPLAVYKKYVDLSSLPVYLCFRFAQISIVVRKVSS